MGSRFILSGGSGSLALWLHGIIGNRDGFFVI